MSRLARFLLYAEAKCVSCLPHCCALCCCIFLKFLWYFVFTCSQYYLLPSPRLNPVIVHLTSDISTVSVNSNCVAGFWYNSEGTSLPAKRKKLLTFITFFQILSFLSLWIHITMFLQIIFSMFSATWILMFILLFSDFAIMAVRWLGSALPPFFPLHDVFFPAQMKHGTLIITWPHICCYTCSSQLKNNRMLWQWWLCYSAFVHWNHKTYWSASKDSAKFQLGNNTLAVLSTMHGCTVTIKRKHSSSSRNPERWFSV